MAEILYQHNAQAYRATVSMLDSCGQAAVIHPTGTGKSFIGFQLCQDRPAANICWLPLSEHIFRTQLENWRAAAAEVVPKCRNLGALRHQCALPGQPAGHGGEAAGVAAEGAGAGGGA